MYFRSETRLDSRLRIAILAATFLFCLLNLSAQTAGDYRTKWAGNFDDLARWEFHNGNTWVNATTLPTTPFTGTLYIRHQTDLYRNFTVLGNIIIAGNGNSIRFRVMDGGVFTLAPAARMEFDNIYIAPGGVLVNNGTMTATVKNSALSIQANGELINNGTINTATGKQISLQITMASSGVDNPAIFTSGPEGSVSGSGSFNANYNSVINIANPGGVDEALHLSEGNSFAGAHFTFNGDTPQITGTTMPAMALSIVFANPESVTLSQDISIREEVIVQSGSSLNLGNSVIYANYYGAGTFTMQDGSQVATTHPEGLSSTGNTGSVRVTIRNYNSNATYVYNGTEPQQTGNFVTSPDPYTVINLIIENPAGVEITNPITVTGTMQVIEGEIAYIEPPTGIDGYYSPTVHRVKIAQNGVLMYNFIATTQAYPNNGFVNRKWTLRGQFNGNKRVTLNWTAAEDGNFNWTAQNRPQVYVSNQSEPLISSWNPSNPRQVTFTADEFPNHRADVYYTIGLGNDETLPVALSSFTATANASGKVEIKWVTQSETNAAGFYLYRAILNELASAERISSLQPANNSSQTVVYNATDSEVFPGNTYYYWLEAVYYDNSSDFFGPVTATIQTNQGNSPSVPIVAGISLISPNPMNSSARISYALETKGQYRIEVYNLRGQRVRSLKEANADKGNYLLYWDGRDDQGALAGSGMYFVRLSQNGKHWQRKLTIAK